MSESNNKDEVTNCIVTGTGPNIADAQDMLAMVKNLDVSELKFTYLNDCCWFM